LACASGFIWQMKSWKFVWPGEDGGTTSGQ